MSYISRKFLIDEILKEAVLAYDDELPENTPHHKRRSLAGTSNVIDDVWSKKPYKRINADWKEIPNSKGGQIHKSEYDRFVNKNINKLIIFPPDRETVEKVMTDYETYGVEHNKTSSDHQVAQFAIYAHALRLFGLVNRKNNLTKVMPINEFDTEAAVNKSRKRVADAFARNTNWKSDTPAEQVIQDIYKSDSLSAIFMKDPYAGPALKKALREPDIDNAFELKGYILDVMERDTIKKDPRHKLTVLENMAARSIAAVDMKMRKAGYRRGIMDVQDMFDYLQKKLPYNYKEILETYDLTPEIIEGFKNYKELCDWIYQPEFLIRVYSYVSDDGRRHNLHYAGNPMSLRSNFADKAAKMEKQIEKHTDNISKGRGRARIAVLGSPELVEYRQEAFDKAEAAFMEMAKRYKELSITNSEEAAAFKASPEYKKAYTKYNNEKTALKKAKEALAAADAGEMEVVTHRDKLNARKKNFRDYLTTKRGEIDESIIAAFDMRFNYPKLMREGQPGLPDDILDDMYEFSFSLISEDYRTFDKSFISSLEEWIEEYINNVETENGFESSIAVSVIPMEGEREDERSLEMNKFDILRIIFDYPRQSYMYDTLSDKNKAKNRMIDIQFDIMEKVEEDNDIVLKPYVKEGHGIAVNQPSKDMLIGVN